MSFITTREILQNSVNEFVPITTWAQTTLSETEKLEFDRVLAERNQSIDSLILDGTIIQCSDLFAQTSTIEWAIDPRTIAKPWLAAMSIFGRRWLLKTNQTRVFELTEQQ